MHTTSSVRFLHITTYAADRMLSQTIHDEAVSVEAVVVLDALVDHLLEQADCLDLPAVAAETRLTGQQLEEALQLLEARGYLYELATHVPAAVALRTGALGLEALCHAA